jgi:hypothetical protein
MNASPDQTRAALRALYGRGPDEIVADLRAVAGVLTRELGTWRDGPPNAAAMTSAETSVEGCRRLLTELRLALRATRPQDAA